MIPANFDYESPRNLSEALTLLQSREAQAFNLASEPQNVRSAYGTGNFGQGCLLARKLIETGVSFVEVTLGGWDTTTRSDLSP